MPTVSAFGHDIECEADRILREVLREAGLSPHNGRAETINCGGLGTCGTCAVEVSGDVSTAGPREHIRLSVPPHDTDSGLRLACQTRVHGDVTVRKYPGFWGQHTERDPER